MNSVILRYKTHRIFKEDINNSCIKIVLVIKEQIELENNFNFIVNINELN